MTILVVNCGIKKSLSILTAVVGPVIKYNVDKCKVCFRKEVKRTVAIRCRISKICVAFGPHTQHSTCAATGNKYIMSDRIVSMNPKLFASDSKRGR
jgi:hypothetical protein